MPPIVKKADFALALLLLIVPAAFLLASASRPAGERAAVRVDGRQTAWISLAQAGRLDIRDESGRIIAVAVCEGGRLHVENAVCPDKICERTVISRAGEAIICLPERMVIEIEGAPYDAQVY